MGIGHIPKITTQKTPSLNIVVKGEIAHYHLLQTCFNPFPHIDIFQRLYNRHLYEKIVAKEEFANDEQFLPIVTMFSTISHWLSQCSHSCKLHKQIHFHAYILGSIRDCTLENSAAEKLTV